MGGPRARGPQFGQVEEAIVETAGKLFDEQGYNQTRVQDIADALGLARSSLYHYYSNKEEILVVGIRRVTTRRNEIVEKSRSAAGGPTERLTWLLHEFALLVDEHPVWIRVLMREEPAIPEHALLPEIESRIALYDLLVDTIRAGIDDGSIRNLDEHMAASIVILTMAGIARRLTASVPDRSDLVSTVVDVVMQGIIEPAPLRGSNLERGLELIRRGMQLIKRGAQPTPGS